MSKETVITCPKCEGACFAPSVVTTKAGDTNIALPGMHYMKLTCQRCSTQLQFVVDLTPSFDRSESACSVVS